MGNKLISSFGYEVLAMCLFVLQVRAAGETGLKGVIRGSGILCYCAKCKGVEVSVFGYYFSSMVFLRTH